MIVKVHGELEAVAGGAALVRVEGLTYEVLIPAYTAARLAGAVGEVVSLHTLHYLEGQGQGTTLLPRLAGFTTLDDRRFFELFTTCKGIGHRKALRAMTLETGQIAAAIADRDAALLQSLPEIGRRTAETIIATLRGKVEPFVGISAATVDGGGPARSRGVAALAREAAEVLLQLGESRVQVSAWIDQALLDEVPPASVQDLVARVYQIKAGA